MSDVGDNISSETQIVFVEASGQLWLNLLVGTSDDKRSERYLRFFVVLDNSLLYCGNQSYSLGFDEQ